MHDKMLPFRRELRINQTKEEKKLWAALRAKQFDGLKFRRQEQIGRFIVDFVCYDKKLVIELDGSQHLDEKEKDLVRDEWLNSQGFTVRRFWNNEVRNNFSGVLALIKEYCDKNPSNPPLTPPIKGGELKE
jgi:very-short-patch-repair endonuclease